MKKSFKQSSSITPFYTGGSISLDTTTLYSPVHTHVQTTSWTTGAPLLTLAPDADTITCLSTSPSKVVLATRSLLVVVYEKESDTPLHSFKAHSAPILAMAWDASGRYMASGSADSTVKVWDMEGFFCTHNFKGHGGIITALAFQPGTLTLISASEDGVIKVWDLVSKKCTNTLQGHVSPVRALDFNGVYMVSGGRDGVFNVWDKSFNTVATVPVYESIESCGFLNCNQIYTAGEKGLLKIWSWKTSTLLHTITVSSSKTHAILSVFHDADKKILIVATEDQNLVVYDVSVTDNTTPARLIRTFAGYNEEILDLSFIGAENTHLAVASNSEQIRIYNFETRDCTILSGHTDIVFSIESYDSGRVLVSGSKDNTVRVWKRSEGDRFEYDCVAVGVGHTESVSAIAICKKSGRFFVSASQDRTIKHWDLTSIAHERDINSLCIAPNEKIYASSSQDKTAKIWSADGTLLGTCKGHKRGVWDIKFSPVDKVLASCSADKTLKIWDLNNFTCIKTFEGHLNSVLQLSFISAGMQLISAGADGLVKLWTVKTNECVGTFDAHDDKIWALSVDESEKFVVTGGADSKVVIWEDFTVLEAEETRVEEERGIIEQQHLNTYIAKKDYKRAVKLALKLDRPVHLLNLLTQLKKNGNVDVPEIIANMIEGLDDDQTIPYERILGLPKIKEVLEGLLAYGERHYERAKRILVSSKIVFFS